MAWNSFLDKLKVGPIPDINSLTNYQLQQLFSGGSNTFSKDQAGNVSTVYTCISIKADTIARLPLNYIQESDEESIDSKRELEFCVICGDYPHRHNKCPVIAEVEEQEKESTLASLSKDIKELNKGFESKEEEKMEYASHYKEGIETRIKKAMVAEALQGSDISLDKWDDISNALKYFDRMGLKGDAPQDAYKCADYLHRAITGEFLNKRNK